MVVIDGSVYGFLLDDVDKLFVFVIELVDCNVLKWCF